MRARCAMWRRSRARRTRSTRAFWPSSAGVTWCPRYVPPLEERALREQLRRRMHLVRLRASAINRIFGLLTQWGLRISRERLRAPDAVEPLADRGVDATWRRSIAEAIAVIDVLDERIAPLERELRQTARGDERVVLLKTIPGVGDLLGLTLASEIGDVARFATPRKLVGYAGLAPRVNQSGDRSRTGALSKAGSRTLRWAAVEAAHAAWRPSNPWHQHYTEMASRAGKNPAKSAVARKVLTQRRKRNEPTTPPWREYPGASPATLTAGPPSTRKRRSRMRDSWGVRQLRPRAPKDSGGRRSPGPREQDRRLRGPPP
jgi:transposase